MSREEPEIVTATSTKEPVGEKQIKVEVSNVEVAGAGLPVLSKVSHFLANVVAGVIALCVAAVLADGASVITLMPVAHLPYVTAPYLKEHLDRSHLNSTIQYRYKLSELLGPSYGVGLHHDQSGASWSEIGAHHTLSWIIDDLGGYDPKTHMANPKQGLYTVMAAVPHVIAQDDLKHPVAFLECNDLKAAGLCAMAFGFIAEVVAVLMVAFHAAQLAGVLPAKVVKPVGALVWATLSAGFLIVLILAVNIYTTTWDCNNPIIPSIKLEDHFHYNYGFYFAIVGYISSVLVLNLILSGTSMNDGMVAPAAPNIGSALRKIVAGTLVGVAVGGIAAIIVLAGNDSFDDESKVEYNYCAYKKPYHAAPGDNYFANTDCFKDSVALTLEQAGANVTAGFKGGIDAGSRVPITKHYKDTDLCPVNVHWHWGAEHLSVGQFDEMGVGPTPSNKKQAIPHRRELAGSTMRKGNDCHHYDATDTMYTTQYDFQYCTDMDHSIGETYEIHWPHSAAGACGTKYQYQTPFYDGVFCKDGVISIAPLNTYKTIGVQGQVYVLVNDGLGDQSPYYNPDLFKGMAVGPAGTFGPTAKGMDMAYYTGSTTGTSRDNDVCSRYTPITWQVDRTCHITHAASFDKMCKDMKQNYLNGGDDMKKDLYPHGARAVSDPNLVANNQQ